MLRELTLDEVVEVTGGALIDGRETVGTSGEEVVTSVSTDSRTTRPAALFVALRGETHDGHAYLADARAKSACALLVDHAVHDAGIPQVVVVDTLHAMGDIARYVRDAFTGPVVGITGSIGKTTTKEMVAAVLEARFSVRKSPANHNNEIGLPQTIFALEPSETALVLEMGMRGGGQILRLAEIGAPTIGVITNVGHSHIELLGSRDAIARAKGELFELLPEADGVAVYPAADDYADTLRARFRGKTTLSCAIDSPADVRATELVRHENGWRATVETPWGRAKLFVPSPGRFNVLNALFAIAVGGHLGIDLVTMTRALARWSPPAMRMETVMTPSGITVLSDAYNAAPDSMAAALETLASTPLAAPGGKRIAILGEMRELGAYSVEGHAAVGRAAASAAPDMLILVGPLTLRIAAGARVAGFPEDRVHHFPTTEEAVAVVPAIVGPGDVVLVKGSRALTMEKIVEALP